MRGSAKSIPTGPISQFQGKPRSAVDIGTGTSAELITLFDGTGVGLQDLAVASVAARLARERGLVTPVTL
jgi:ornithine cyclodeaminase